MTHPSAAPARISGSGRRHVRSRSFALPRRYALAAFAAAARMITATVGIVRSSPTVTGARLSLWRAAALFRVVSLLFCLALVVKWRNRYAHLPVAYLVLALMVVVTGVVCALALTGRAHRWWVVVVDAGVTAVLTWATVWAQTSYDYRGGHLATLTTVWAAGPAIEAALLGGWVGGVAFGLVQFAAALAVRHGYDGHTIYSGALLVIVGGVIGYVASLVVRTEQELAEAVAAQSAAAERERLARSIHDGVLQVLGLVHRTGRDAGGRWAELAAEAATQEAMLRALITSRPAAPVAVGVTDLTDDLRALGRDRITVSAPAQPVLLDALRTAEITAAVRAALHNIAEHNGPDVRAWVLLEDIDDALEITVRDDGAGFGPERLAAAEADGRLGVSSSIRARVAELGGRATVTSTPGAGTTVHISLPRRERSPR